MTRGAYISQSVSGQIVFGCNWRCLAFIRSRETGKRSEAQCSECRRPMLEAGNRCPLPDKAFLGVLSFLMVFCSFCSKITTSNPSKLHVNHRLNCVYGQLCQEMVNAVSFPAPVILSTRYSCL